MAVTWDPPGVGYGGKRVAMPMLRKRVSDVGYENK